MNRTLGTLTAADLGKRLTVHTDRHPADVLTGTLVRIDHDLTWATDATTFVGFASDADRRRDPDVLLQRHGVRLPADTPIAVEEP